MTRTFHPKPQKLSCRCDGVADCLQSEVSEGGEDEQLAECDDLITGCSGDGCVEVSGEGPDEMPSSTDAQPTTTTDSPTPTTESPTSFTDSPLPSTNAPTPSTDAETPSTDVPIPSTDAPARSTDIPTPSTDVPMEEEEIPVNVGDDDLATVFEDGAIPPVDLETPVELPKAREPKVVSISEGDDVRLSSASLLSNLLASLYEEEK